MSVRLTLVAALAAVAFTGTANATTFDLSTVATGTTPTFTITSGGQTATFTSPAGNGFATQNTAGLFTFPTALVDNNFFGTDNLIISFSSPVTNEILIPFGILDAFGTGDSLTATTSNGTVRTFATTNDALALGEPEGTIAFVPNSAINSITLSSAQGLPFAIGNVTVPEPMSLSLLGLSLAGMAAIRRRRNV